MIDKLFIKRVLLRWLDKHSVLYVYHLYRGFVDIKTVVGIKRPHIFE